jgi:hypothetical protein
MKGTYKKYSSRFMPNKIRYLLIGESPPYTTPDEALKYFYNHENSKGGQILLSSVSYSFFSKKFYQDKDDKEGYLRTLQKTGIFLLDATYEPINKIKSKKLRRSKISEAYPQLKKSISSLPLQKKAKIILIHNNVIKAIGNNLREDFKYRFYYIGFPRYYNDKRFKERIQDAIQD